MSWHRFIITSGAIKRLAVLCILLAVSCCWGWWTMIRMPLESFRGPLAPLSERETGFRDSLRSDVKTLAGTIGDRNVFVPQRLAAAARFIESSLKQAGYEVGRQEFVAAGVTCLNLEAEIRGRDLPDEIVVVGAHYDSVRGCPAANDNGSGVAATLALARSFASAAPARTLRFLFFPNEEPPLFQTPQMGSWVYAKRCRQRGENVVAMLSLETIGYYSDDKGSQGYPLPFSLFYPSTGNFIAFVGNHGSRRLVRRAVGSFRRHTQFPSEAAALPGFITGIGWSDHWAFWQEGFEAIMVTDTAPFRYPYYHGPSDTPDKLDYDRTARVVEGLRRVVEDLVGDGCSGGRGLSANSGWLGLSPDFIGTKPRLVREQEDRGFASLSPSHPSR